MRYENDKSKIRIISISVNDDLCLREFYRQRPAQKYARIQTSYAREKVY